MVMCPFLVAPGENELSNRDDKDEEASGRGAEGGRVVAEARVAEASLQVVSGLADVVLRVTRVGDGSAVGRRLDSLAAKAGHVGHRFRSVAQGVRHLDAGVVVLEAVGVARLVVGGVAALAVVHNGADVGLVVAVGSVRPDQRVEAGNAVLVLGLDRVARSCVDVAVDGTHPGVPVTFHRIVFFTGPRALLNCIR